MNPTQAPDSTPITTDALVIGAGPVGLFQVFQLGLLGLHAEVVDSLPGPGGQCTELYPDKPIYDIPALPLCTGRELAERLLQQVAPFQPRFHTGQQVTRLEAVEQADGTPAYRVDTDAGLRFMARTVFIAAGVGSFQPRHLTLEGAAAFEGQGLLYRRPEPTTWAGRDVVVMGDDDAALEAAIACAAAGPQRAASVTLMHRREVFRATADTVAQMRALCEQGAMRFVAGQPVGLKGDAEGQLSAVQVALPDGSTTALPAQRLLVLLGLSPKLGPIADWGLAIERKQLRVDTERFETALPGVYAVGDINTYPGKRKLIVSGFHEATLAAYAAAARLSPEGRVLLQYTTTSPLLQQRLGVLPDKPAPVET